MPRSTFDRKASTLGSSQYAAAVPARISSGQQPAGIETGRTMLTEAMKSNPFISNPYSVYGVLSDHF
jgi:hypothetical protein